MISRSETNTRTYSIGFDISISRYLLVYIGLLVKANIGASLNHIAEPVEVFTNCHVTYIAGICRSNWNAGKALTTLMYEDLVILICIDVVLLHVRRCHAEPQRPCYIFAIR